LIVSSYGWSGAAAKRIHELLSKSGFRIVEAIEFQGAAGEAELKRVRGAVKSLCEQ